MKKREGISRRSFLVRTSSVLLPASCIGGALWRTAGCSAGETASQPAPAPAGRSLRDLRSTVRIASPRLMAADRIRIRSQ